MSRNKRGTVNQVKLNYLYQLQNVLYEINCYPKYAIDAIKYMLLNNIKITKNEIIYHYQGDKVLYNLLMPLSDRKIKLLLHINKLISEPYRIPTLADNKEEVKQMFKISSLGKSHITMKSLKLSNSDNLTQAQKYSRINNVNYKQVDRYVIGASLKKPSNKNTLGYYEVIAGDGSTVYIIVIAIPKNEEIKKQKDMEIYSTAKKSDWGKKLVYYRNLLAKKLNGCKGNVFVKCNS